MSQDFVIENAVLSYPHLFQPSVAKGSTEARYGAALILPPSFNWDQCQQAIQEAIAAEWPQGVDQSKLRTPYEQVTEGPYAGSWQLKAYRKQDNGPPQVVMQDPNVKVGPHQAGEFFAGAIVNAYVRAYGYPQGGVSLYLNAVQLVNNDANLPRLDNQKAATEVFQTVPGGPAATAGVAGQPAGFPGGQQPAGASAGAYGVSGQPQQAAAPAGGPGMMPAGMPAQAVPAAQPAAQPAQAMPQGVPGSGVPTGAPTAAPAGQPPAGMPWNQ